MENFIKTKLLEAFDYAKKNNKSIHFMGLLSDGGVHSHIEHLFGLLEMARRKEAKAVYIHAFMDGRDTPPMSGINYINALEEKIIEIGVGKIATISGRYYAMDRDTNWERTEKAYDTLIGMGEYSSLTPKEVMQKFYNEK